LWISLGAGRAAQDEKEAFHSAEKKKSLKTISGSERPKVEGTRFKRERDF